MRPSTPARRGRPPKSEALDTHARLLAAAASACVDHGFDGATLQEIARRAGLTATAVYNHFASREDLLYAAGVRGLEQITEAAEAAAGQGFAGIAAAYLHPDVAEARRLLAELHLASRRDERLAHLLGEWHRTEAERAASLIGDRLGHPEATVKALFLMLLGLCHLEDLASIEADPEDLGGRIAQMIEAIAPTRRR